MSDTKNEPENTAPKTPVAPTAWYNKVWGIITIIGTVCVAAIVLLGLLIGGGQAWSWFGAVVTPDPVVSFEEWAAQNKDNALTNENSEVEMSVKVVRIDRNTNGRAFAIGGIVGQSNLTMFFPFYNEDDIRNLKAGQQITAVCEPENKTNRSAKSAVGTGFQFDWCNVAKEEPATPVEPAVSYEYTIKDWTDDKQERSRGIIRFRGVQAVMEPGQWPEGNGWMGFPLRLGCQKKYDAYESVIYTGCRVL